MSFFNFEGFFSEEDREKMKEARERGEMLREEFRHSFQRLFDELDQDHLRTVALMLRILSESSGAEDVPLVHEWSGIASWALRVRFGICITCGQKHEEMFEDDEEESTHREPMTVKPLGRPAVGPEHKGRNVEDVPLPAFYELSETDKLLMKEYHLDDLRIEGTGELIGFICTGINGMNGPCGMRYPTIEDRMIKGPEECSGCFTKMAHG